MSYIAVIGAGSWGTTLSRLLAEKGYDVSLWVYENDLCGEMKVTRINSVYLPEFSIPHNVLITSDIKEALHQARYILNVVPTQYARAIMKSALPHIHSDSVIINASKGIEQKSLLTFSGIMKELTHHNVAVLSGPSFAHEVGRKLPTAVTLSSDDAPTALLLQEIFNTHYFRVYTHDDTLGVELGGALKNVIAIASGISDGLRLGHNARAALLTRGLAEIVRLGGAMGAREQTFSGLSGLGDLLLTCTALLSRNYTLGTKLALGLKLNDILSQSKSVIEGVATCESAYELSRKYAVQMPFVEQIYMVLYEGKDPGLAVAELMNRALKTEFHA
ncbi:MAG TPA: NAD(P)H-dependent glycerol-3-phosphate dehydrogenase [Thermodesulfovibrionales bacterium]|nr:NAD(P)H-dependent glycerol-3-phosphate dehydrogenase [Thermodesulfovibrionales bacterium]